MSSCWLIGIDGLGDCSMMTTSGEGGEGGVGEMPLLVDVDGDVALGIELLSFPYWLKE